jgi:D-tyrosyl-tRNA(Tyr) deacylase
MIYSTLTYYLSCEHHYQSNKKIMRVVIQRVRHAKVNIKPDYEASIGQGLLIFLGIEDADTDEDTDWLIRKISQMRLFSDDEGKMNLSLLDKNLEALVISQFTLHASTKKGNRPSFIKAGKPDFAKAMYQQFIEKLQQALSTKVKSGVFGADMQVSLLNDGPVTLFIDTKDRQ